MPDKKGRFTGPEKVLIETMVETGSRSLAGQRAGFAGPAGVSMALQRPAVAEAIAIRVREKFENLLPAAFSVLEWAMTNETVPANARLKASTYVIDNLKGSGAEDGKAPDEMTAEELAAFAQRARLQLAAAEDRLADQAKDISPKTDESIFD